MKDVSLLESLKHSLMKNKIRSIESKFYQDIKILKAYILYINNDKDSVHIIIDRLGFSDKTNKSLRAI